MAWVQCLNCEYDLRGTADAKRCPECGVWVDVRGVPFPARRTMLGRVFVVGFVACFLLMMAVFYAMSYLPRFGFVLVPADKLWLVVTLMGAGFWVYVFCCAPLYRFFRRVLTGKNEWPLQLAVHADGVHMQRTNGKRLRLIRFWPWTKIYRVSRRRVPSGHGIRLGTIRLVRILILETEIEVKCRPVEAEMIVREIRKQIDAKKAKPA